jgi:hypothetical protein
MPSPLTAFMLVAVPTTIGPLCAAVAVHRIVDLVAIPLASALAAEASPSFVRSGGR